jgi:hypothetical protein
MPSRFLPDVLRGDRGRKGATGDPSVVPGPPGPAGSYAWHDLAFVDFTAQPDQLISADGPLVVGGSSFVAYHYARRIAGSVFSVESGATKGLRLPCPDSAYAGTTTANQGQTTKLFLPFSLCQSYGSVSSRTPLRCLARLSRIVGVSDPHEVGFCLCFDNPSASLLSTTFHSGKTAYGVNYSLGNLSCGCYFLGVSSGGYNGVSGISGDNRVLGVECDGVGPRLSRACIAPSSLDAVDNPDLAYVYREFAVATTYSGSGVQSSYFDLANWGVSICAYAGGSTFINAGDICYVSHLRVQAFY